MYASNYPRPHIFLILLNLYKPPFFFYISHKKNLPPPPLLWLFTDVYTNWTRSVWTLIVFFTCPLKEIWYCKIFLLEINFYDINKLEIVKLRQWLNIIVYIFCILYFLTDTMNYNDRFRSVPIAALCLYYNIQRENLVLKKSLCI